VASAGVDTDAAIDAALARTADATALVKAGSYTCPLFSPTT